MPSLHEVVVGGVELESMRALRDRLASDIDQCDSMRDLASLAQRLTDVLKRISELEGKAPAVRSPLDEIAERRKSRKKPVRNGVKREAT